MGKKEFAMIMMRPGNMQSNNMVAQHVTVMAYT